MHEGLNNPTTEEVRGHLTEFQNILENKEIKVYSVALTLRLNDRAGITIIADKINPADTGSPDYKSFMGEFGYGPNSIWSTVLAYIKALPSKAERDQMHFLKLASDALEFARKSGNIEAVILSELEATVKKLSSNILEDKSQWTVQ